MIFLDTLLLAQPFICSFKCLSGPVFINILRSFYRICQKHYSVISYLAIATSYYHTGKSLSFFLPESGFTFCHSDHKLFMMCHDSPFSIWCRNDQ